MPAAKIRLKGQVQGLGFRPYVFRLAKRLGLTGTVTNSLVGVEIYVEGGNTPDFVRALKDAPPKLARVSSIQVTRVKPVGLAGFSIIGSDAAGAGKKNAVDILPDLACCEECRRDIGEPTNRRHDYPFANCTQCGPRYSIVQSLPYDRPRTTMKGFRMCPTCQTEYDNPVDRRFHAQPNCCPICGPRLTLLHANGEKFDEINPLATATRLLIDGKILGIKSLGGFHLVCDALNESAVAELRRRKARRDKPLAIMCADAVAASRLCTIDSSARRLLESEASPIVLLPRTKKPAVGWEVAPSVAPGVGYLGVMLAYAPLHHLLLRAGDSGPSLRVLVMTSANPKDEPVISTLSDLVARLGSVVDYILDNDRPIANRCDDSVAFVVQVGDAKHRTGSDGVSGNVMVRRSRGFAPSPILLDPKRFRLRPTLACGAALKNTFAICAGPKVYLSPHIGDMGNASSLSFFEQTLESYKRWFDIKPEAVACDLHPDLLSTRFAENLALKSHRPLVRVQHHHAHIASVIAEHNLAEPVLGIALDGTGLGSDGRIWGCELLLAGRRRCERLGHLRYLPLVGGETAILEPARTAAGYLAYLFGAAAPTRVTAIAKLGSVASQFHLDSNVVFTSSAGRLFDAVSAMAGVCVRASYDGQAPALLESVVDTKEKGSYFAPDQLRCDAAGMLVIDPAPWLSRVVDDLASGVTPARVSRRFHTTFVQALASAARQLARSCGTKIVCLSGGSFQNRILLTELARALLVAGLKPYTNHMLPANDGGVAFGQLIVADAQPSGGKR
jgi:hydrogenase maturation protein HypF